MPRHRPNRADVPLLPFDLVRLAVYAARHDSRANRHGEAEALGKLGRMARVIVPARGVLAPIDEDLDQDIHTIARKHLGYERASRSFRVALERVGRFEHGDAIETAHAAVVHVTSVAYYYTGLAFGLTVGDLSRK